MRFDGKENAILRKKKLGEKIVIKIFKLTLKKILNYRFKITSNKKVISVVYLDRLVLIYCLGV